MEDIEMDLNQTKLKPKLNFLDEIHDENIPQRYFFKTKEIMDTPSISNRGSSHFDSKL